MKDFIISLILAAILIVVFSVFGQKEGTTTPITGFGTTYESDSGMVIPGSGSEQVRTYTPEELLKETEPEEVTSDTEQAMEETCPKCNEHKGTTENGGTEMAEYIETVLVLLVLTLILRLRRNAILKKIKELENDI